MKKIVALVLAVLMLAALVGCGEAAAGTDRYVVGICQMMPHQSLEDASQGFQDALITALGEDRVMFKHQDAGGEYATCATIIDGFLAEHVDLILANATVPLQAAVSAVAETPVLGTSVTDYATALNMDEWNGLVGGNISGTTDLAPLDQQAAVIAELFPEAKTVGLLYCSGEPNSVYQVTRVEDYLTALGYRCTSFAFVDVNDLSAVCEAACNASDVIYIPTDNTCAMYTENIANVVLPAGVPVVTGDASTCAAAGVATFSIDYYDLGYVTGEMAAKILTGEADISTMAVESVDVAEKIYNPVNCEKLGITVPDGYRPVS